tara:strand:+ start:3880 stop:4752 length:873 start_codon:yes stop_codon:yes gene_type:complete
LVQLFYSNATFGPGKVVHNLIQGLELLGVDFDTNNPRGVDPNFPAYCLSPHPILQQPEHLIIGPNICVLPPDSKVVMEQRYKNILVPCDWVYQKYSRWLPLNKIKTWPVGIDTNSFRPENQEKNNDCLIYFKNRTDDELETVKRLLDVYQQSYEVVEYGHYNEETFLTFVQSSRYCFVLDNTESQGIAIQEMMSCNLPLFVWDKTEWDHRGEEHICKATSVPYWDAVCGEKVERSNLLTKRNDFLTSVPEKFEKFLENLNNYSPRVFIKENLSLQKQAKALLSVYENNTL